MAAEKNNNKPRAVILRTAGTNCAYETQYALEKYHIFVLPGGFTYGDDIAAGKVLANQLRQQILDELTRFIDDGKLIIGICNGF
ncbi:MAG: phosphoribosylformylglycinamidine synthase subunit PurQ, partial [Planctomycetota bacterium]